MPKRIPLLLLAVALVCPTSFAGTTRARVVVGLSTGDTQAARLQEIAASVQKSFGRRGLAADSILVLAHEGSRPLRRDAVLAALAPSADAAPDDETWIVLLGTAAPGRDGRPTFQVSGPRLGADDLAAAVAKLPGRKFVVVATAASGGFLPPLLALPEVEALAATADQGEISEPRFAAFWAEALAARPTASFAELASAAANRVAAHYTENSLAQGEHARRIDRATGRIVEAPFASTAPEVAAARPPAASAPAEEMDIAGLQIPRSSGTEEIERRPADDESRGVLAAARAAAVGSEHAALILATEVELLVARDFSSRETWRTRAYLRTGEALDDLGTLRLNSEPGSVTATLVTARVIRPDGAQLIVDPSARSTRRAAETEEERKKTPAQRRVSPRANSSEVELPEVTADCVVEAEWTLDRRADGELPEFYREWNFAERYPLQRLRVRLSLPREDRWRAFAPNIPAGFLQVERSQDLPANDIYLWRLSELPAYEALAGDPPARSVTPWLGVSSVASWDSFAAWYRRLATGSESAGPGVEALAAEIAAAHPDRAGRLRAAYDRVSALRYVAIELGVGALRPRTPEQVWQQRHGDCKDKANLLVAVLTRLGIPAEFALVNRFGVTFPDFPGWQFNHALARVPAAPAEGQPTDLWLDATDRLVPFGIIGPGDLDRQALVFAPDFAGATLHPISAAQEPPSEWRETFAHDAAAREWRITLAASGSAEVTLRHLLLGLGPAARRERLRALLAWPGATVIGVSAPDVFDLATPHTISFRVRAPADAPAPRPLVPGLEAYLARADGSGLALWDEGRPWRFSRVGAGFDQGFAIPARLPAQVP